MNPTDYLTDKLEALHNRISDCNIRYEYNSNANLHLIEVTPLEIYNGDEFIKEESTLEENFEKLFPSEEIIFISLDSLNKIKAPILELYHKKEIIISADFNVADNYMNFAEHPYDDYINQSVIETNYALAA